MKTSALCVLGLLMLPGIAAASTANTITDLGGSYLRASSIDNSGLAAGESKTVAHEHVHRWQCVAKYYDYTQRDVRILDVQSGYVEILTDSVRLNAFVWFGAIEGTTYQIKFENAERVVFVSPGNALVGGSISRANGAISLSSYADATRKQLTHFLTGRCRPA